MYPTQNALSTERIENVSGRYAEEPDTSDTGSKKDNHSRELGGIRFMNGPSDTPRYPDTEDEDEGITVSDGIRVDRNKPDTKKVSSNMEIQV